VATKKPASKKKAAPRSSSPKKASGPGKPQKPKAGPPADRPSPEATSGATEPSKLTLKQHMYIEAYLRTGNATQAAREAGYEQTDEALRVTASRLLTKANIQQRIQERIAEAQIETDEVLGTLASIMRGSLEDFLERPDWGPPKINLELAQQRGVLHLLKELATEPDGSIKIKLHDSLQAAVQLSRIMNLDKSQQRTGTLTISQIRAALAKKNKQTPK
jgi:phage terminase small subunit